MDLIDEETERVVTEIYSECLAVLRQHKAELEKLQLHLAKKESLSGKEIEELLGLKLKKSAKFQPVVPATIP